MQTVGDFIVGDTVRHPNGAVGRVVSFGPEGPCKDTCVHVAFGPVPHARYPKRPWRGAYPDSWLREYALTKIETQ